MKIIIEKEEWQLLGQLVAEIRSNQFEPKLLLQAVMIHEFATENASAFEMPERRSRKLKLSMVVAINTYLMCQPTRDDPYWDLVLFEFRGKIHQILNRYPNLLATKNVFV